MTIGNFSGLYPNYPMYTNSVYPSVKPTEDIDNPNAVDPSADPDKVKKPGKRSSPEDCETCSNRKYQDGSDENVSFKTASHISPESAGSRVRAHEGEHVSNAYKKAAQKDGKVLNASVAIHTSICPECGRTYVSGGVTNTMIKYSNEDNPYTKNQKQLDAAKFKGANIDYAA
ncbi:MAG: hypothetical protein OSJ73_03375 [Lachnospiraceae bacterium]|nr:hypothetical protein [Lachnospiraceae bacterium]GFI24215.1 hypothetical protein IMSAGC011_03011 [Lachnospiraceae bacterium]